MKDSITCVKLTYRNDKPVAEIWNGTWTICKDVIWFLSVRECLACVKPGAYDLIWDCL